MVAMMATLSWTSGGQAAEYEYEPTKEVIVFHGTIEEGDYQRFASLVETIDPSKKIVVGLASNGGAVREALAIGTLIHDRYFATLVWQDFTCASACGLIWLAGTPRVIMHPEGRVGFHAAYTTAYGVALENGMSISVE
jgi:hypothetical protein